MNMVTKKRKPYWNRFRDTSTFSRDQQAQNSCVGDSAYRWCLSTSTCGHANCLGKLSPQSRKMEGLKQLLGISCSRFGLSGNITR